MAANLNRVFLAGNLTRDPEMRFTTSGTAVASLRLAVNRTFTTKEGVKKEDPTFVTVVVWDRQAQLCQEYLKKGSPVLIEGRLQFRSWETPEKEKRSALEVVAERVQFLPGRRDEGGSGEEEIEYQSSE